MRPSSVLLCLCVLACLPTPGQAGPNGFRAQGSAQRRSTLVTELLEVLGAGRRRSPTETDLRRIEEVLEPIFLALPRNANGTLGAAASRYALHRAFIQLHGWRVKGLHSAGEAWADLAPVALGSGVPEELRSLFEERIAGGVGLRELAVVASALEHEIHGESEGRLRALYAALGHPSDAKLSATDAAAAIDAYAATFVLGVATANITTQYVTRVMQAIHRLFPAWPATRSFARELQKAVLGNSSEILFGDVEAVIEEFSQRYGRWQNSDCLDLKADLVALEERKGNGRVLLSDFYHATIHQEKWFNESPEFLQQQGSLDDSEPQTPRVIIPNYVNAPASCIAIMRHYSVCCIDECEDLLGQLERHFMAPSAEPAAISAFVAALPSSSVPAPRALAPKLRARLEEVAAQHGGQVPLHGRLFAQWLHHAYPRECPYPQISGTTTPRTAREFSEHVGRTHKASKVEMQRHIDEGRAAQKQAAPSNNCDEADDEGQCSALPWEAHEELVDPHAHRVAMARREAPGPLRQVLRSLAFVMALGTMGVVLTRLTDSLRPESKGGDAPVIHLV